MQVVDDTDIVPVGEEVEDILALTMADLEREQAVGFERGVGLGDEAAVDVQAVRTGEERGGGLEVADLGMEGRAVGGWDVGRVGDDDIKGRFAGDRAEQIGDEEADAVVERVEHRVGVGNFNRFGGEVERGDLSVREVVGERDGDGARPGADVEYMEGCDGIEFGENCLDEVLGLGAGDEH